MLTPYITEERKLFQDSIHKFMKEECPREYVRECDANKRYPVELVKKAGKLGWYALTMPEEYGGHGDYLDMVILLEGVGYYFTAYGRDFFRTVGMVGGAIAHFGSAKQKDEYLPRLVRGDICSLAFALSEPDAGSDAAGVRTKAILDGDHFTVNGSKIWITGSLVADYFLVVVRTDPEEKKHKGMSLLLIPQGVEGLRINPIDLLGGHGVRSCHVDFEDVRVPADCLLGELHNGWINLIPTLTKERAFAAATASGGGQAVVDDAVRYAKERVQFGRPIGKFQIIQHKLADMQIKVDASRLLAYQAGYMLSQGLPAVRECSSAKIYASDAYMQVAVEGVQILGGYGYSMEFDMQRHFREAKLFQIAGGTNEIQHSIVAHQLGL